MTPSARTLIAVVLAGVVGTAANSAVVSALIEAARFVTLATSPGRLTVAILVAALLPLIAARMAGASGALAAIAALTVIPSLLAKFVFGVGAPWGFVLAVNAVYAVAAWLTYRAVMRAG
jgi:hypothetical protein